jgi:hypothetical protein
MSVETTARLRHRAAVLKSIFPECYQEVDGYYVWFPRTAGCWTSEDLKVIAELLDEANRMWDEHLVKWFKEIEERDRREGRDDFLDE